MSNSHVLDDRYKEGVWYDLETGDFLSFQEDNGEIEVVNPMRNTVLETVNPEQWGNWYRDDLRAVSDEAVNDPVSIINDTLDRVSDSEGELDLPFSFIVDLRYARRKIEIIGQR